MEMDIVKPVDKRRGNIAWMIFAIIFIALLLYPFLTYPDPPPEQEGILVNLGVPDIGSGVENAPAPAPPAEADPEPEPDPEPDPLPEPDPEPEPEPEEVSEPEVVTTEDPDAIRLKREAEAKKEREEARKKKEREAKEAERKREERKERERRERERKEREAKEAAAKAKAEAEAKASDFGESLGLEGMGKGKGDTGKAGNQGDPNGDPNADALKGVSTGSGRVGGGLGSRGVKSSPKVTDNSQKSGTIVVNVCVDANGRVVSSKFKQLGSSTTDPRLVSLAESNAKRWKFDPGDGKTCGTITYVFKVQ